MYNSIRDVFQNGNPMIVIRQMERKVQILQNLDLLGIFVDNHDNARFLNGNKNHRLIKSALAFTLTGRGIPFLYYGSEQGYACA